MSIEDKAYNWFKDLKPFSKIGILFLFILISLLFSNYTGYVKNLSITYKSESITTLKNLQKSNANDNTLKAFTDSIINDIIKDKPITFYLSRSLEGYTNSIIKNNTKINNQFIFYNLYFHLCAAGGFYLLSVFAFVALLFLGKEQRWIQRTQQAVGVSILLLILSIFLTFILSLIPIIPIGNFKTNYLIAFLIQLSLFYLMYNHDKKKKVESKTPPNN